MLYYIITYIKYDIYLLTYILLVVQIWLNIYCDTCYFRGYSKPVSKWILKISTYLFEYMPPLSLSCNNNKHLTFPPPSFTQLFPHPVHRLFDKTNMTGVMGGARTAYPLEVQRSLRVLSEVHIAQPLLFCAVFCQPLFVFSSIFFLVIVFSVLRFGASDYLIVSSNLFICYYCKLSDDQLPCMFAR